MMSETYNMFETIYRFRLELSLNTFVKNSDCDLGHQAFVNKTKRGLFELYIGEI